jgi:hypothetical protein
VAVVDIDVHFGNGTSEILKGDPRAFFGCVHMIHGEDNEGFEEKQFKCCPGLSPKDSLGGERFQHGFFPHALGCTQVSENYISVGVYPESARNLDPLSALSSTATAPDCSSYNSAPPPPRCGSSGFRSALTDVIIPNMERFDPELLIISGPPLLTSCLSLTMPMLSCLPLLQLALMVTSLILLVETLDSLQPITAGPLTRYPFSPPPPPPSYLMSVS